jgi:hypothetical protein
MLVMFFTRLYISLALYGRVSTEVDKNIETLFVVQRRYFMDRRFTKRVVYTTQCKLKQLFERFNKTGKLNPDWLKVPKDQDFLGNYKSALGKRKAVQMQERAEMHFQIEKRIEQDEGRSKKD